MYIRCSDCLSSTWVDAVDPEGGLVDAVECGDCSRRYLLNPIEQLGDSVRDHYRRAQDGEFSEAEARAREAAT